MKYLKLIPILVLCYHYSTTLFSKELAVNDFAPLFKTKDYLGKDFDLNSQKGRWLILYFFPKADTPGCTKQAISFREINDKLKKLSVNVFGISSDNVEDLKKFHEKFQLNFPLLSDSNLSIIHAYGSQMPLLNYSKRWTFILDPDLVVKYIDKDVVAEKDATNVVAKLESMMKNK